LPYCPQTPAQQTSQPAPPVQSEFSRQWCGVHHLGPDPIAFATHVWMNSSLAGSASILCAASAQAICASISHRLTKAKRASPASLCSVAFALQVWPAASVLPMSKPQSTKVRARGCISHAGSSEILVRPLFDLVRLIGGAVLRDYRFEPERPRCSDLVWLCVA
jgi:hypothetical protein